MWQSSSGKRHHTEQAVASIAAVGEISLNATREQWPAVIKMLRKLRPVLPGMDLTTSSLSNLMAVGDSGDAPNIFGYIAQTCLFCVGGRTSCEPTRIFRFCRLLRSSLGVSLLSLANQNVLEQESSWVVSMVHRLESAGMRWVGLSGKQHDIVNVNGVRVGILGFCGVYGQCKDAPGGAPFVPLKYTPKVATGAVNELNEAR